MFTLSEILWSTTGELNFERAYIRLRRQFSIYERDWRRLPLFFDYEIEEQPEFLERRKLAKQFMVDGQANVAVEVVLGHHAHK